MVPILLQTVSLVGILLYFSAIICLLKKKVLTINYTLMWIFSGTLMVVIVIFPTILNNISELVEKAFGNLKERLNLRRALVSSEQSLEVSSS